MDLDLLAFAAECVRPKDRSTVGATCEPDTGQVAEGTELLKNGLLIHAGVLGWMIMSGCAQVPYRRHIWYSRMHAAPAHPMKCVDVAHKNNRNVLLLNELRRSCRAGSV